MYARACKYCMYFVWISISQVKTFLTLLLSFTKEQHMDRKFDISIVVSAFPLASVHLFILLVFVVPIIYLKMLCHPRTDPVLSWHPYMSLHICVTRPCCCYCALSFVVKFYLIWEQMWLWIMMCEYYLCLPITAEVIRVPVKYLCCWNLWE
jgi:hypothetical protein